ncbi:tRNA (N6-isopentenyl adenosine(37)-C2)-methylthiotransferase MiaB [Sandaracinobacteroides hominis]|uniref:tRNA (N6-isopentenyl adenosine(37)-C2)-methylthiotransferase MiaB n=1 Tax=Sandaracinobacteroides hominis TaxID=2780086 RepID=UPI0018F75142|nr:tRNA (N6-isopentenyl adenosine(37)-C2)-methylthiotransferase MiaB [Sandaracinobacteroides hominis]
MRTFAVKSFGCQMNVYDAERMGEALQADGMVESDELSADILVLNTCHIREKAAEKLYSEIGRIAARAADAGEKRPVIAVTGCVAQAEGAEILKRTKAVDLVVGPQAYHRLPDLLKQQEAGARGIVDLDMPASPKFDALPARRKRGPSAFLTVQEGCDKFCAFCVVPYTRGAEASRPLDAILSEARELAEGGAREITLLGQNVNAWADGNRHFGDMVAAIAAIDGVSRVRYTTSHPRDVTEAMVRAHADIPQMMPYLHLPVQSGSNRILAAMNRKHDRAFYMGLIQRFRDARPDLAITSDFIVGFPGETEEDFADTLSIVEEVGYAQAFSFKYSPRLGTPAAERNDQVPEEVKAERLQRLQALISAKSLAFNRRMVGQRCEILIERRGKFAGQWIGKSPWLQSVVVTNPELKIGDLVQVELVFAGPNSLEGQELTPVIEPAW